MSRRVNIVLLCEDTQQEVFLRRFLKKMGWDSRRIRIERAPGGTGSGEQFVRTKFPTELRAYRQNRNRDPALLVASADPRRLEPGAVVVQHRHGGRVELDGLAAAPRSRAL